MLQQLTSEDEEFLSYATYGLWGEYSAFGQLSLRHPVDLMSDDPLYRCTGSLLEICTVVRTAGNRRRIREARRGGGRW